MLSYADARISDNYEVNHFKLTVVVDSYNDYNCVKFQVIILNCRAFNEILVTPFCARRKTQC